MKTTIRSIAVGIATVSEPDPLLGPAIALAERTGAELHLIHAFQLPDPLLHAYAREGYLGTDFGIRYRESFREQLESHVRALSRSERVHCHAVSGPASEALCDQAEALEADVLVVGASRSGRLLRAILGSTAERVVRGSRIPVLVLREPLEAVRRILVATDLSELSGEAQERGLDVAEALFPGERPELRALLVVWSAVSLPPPLRPEGLPAFARGELETFLAARRKRAEQLEPVVRSGDPANEIAAHATEWDADLVILGTRGRGKSRFLLGSVAEATVRATLTNVLVIPPPSVAEPTRERPAEESSAGNASPAAVA